jgi:hypothetical protein
MLLLPLFVPRSRVKQDVREGATGNSCHSQRQAKPW